MGSSKRIFQLMVGALVVMTFVAGAVMLVVPPPVSVPDALTLHLRTGTAVLVTFSSLSGAILFAQGVRGFRTKLRVAYILIAIGVALFGFSLVQLPVAAFLNLWDSWWLKSGMVIVPFVCATTLMYVGVRQFARLIEVEVALTSYKLTTTLTLVFAVVSFFLGHYVVHDHAVAGTDFYTAVVGWSAINLTYAALLTRRIRQRIGVAYQSAARWLAVAFALMALSAWHEYTINFFMNTNSWYVAHGLSLIPFIVSGLAMVRAGYAFCLLSVDVVPFIPVATGPELLDQDYIDSITRLAGLASDIKAIDSLLNPLRHLTASLAPGQALDATSKRQLLQIYKELEDYMVLGDPVRTYPRDDLRGKLRPAYRTAVEQYAP